MGFCLNHALHSQEFTILFIFEWCPAAADLFVAARAAEGGVATAILGITDVARGARAVHPQRIEPLLHQLILPIVHLICMSALRG